MASIQARHIRRCAGGRPWTTFETALEGCTCPRGPMYHVVTRHDGKLVREPIGHNRKHAERALRKTSVEVDEGTYRPQPTIRFRDWSARWLKALQRKQTTVDSYRSTIAYADDTFGDVVVRRLRPEHVARMDETMRERKLSASTRAKHLRVLHTCLQSAVSHGYAGSNAVRELPPAERPRPTRKESAYFEDDELPRLLTKVPEGGSRVLFVVALKTGMRLGELLALTWADVDLSDQVLRVRRTFTDGHLSAPKNHERRDVDLTPDVVKLLGQWWGELGKPADETLVFPGPVGHLDGTAVLRGMLYLAMKAAEVPRVGPTGEKRTFHSLRHTFARIALEHGAELTWLSRHLGHSSTAITDGVYGHWARKARKAQAKRLARAFPV